VSTYLVVDIEVMDAEMYERYIERIPEVVHHYGGRYVVRGGTVTPLAGGWSPDRMIIVEFASDGDLYAFVTSDEYNALAPLRENSTRTRSIALHGVELQP
jgi:uncharacterized protein (DUF1330 family)